MTPPPPACPDCRCWPCKCRVGPAAHALPWLVALQLRAHWLLPLALLVLLAYFKDWPPPSCQAKG